MGNFTEVWWEGGGGRGELGLSSDGYLRRYDFMILTLRTFFKAKSNIGIFKNPFAMITSLSELYLRIRRFFSLVQTKKVISRNYGNSTRKSCIKIQI